MCKFESKIKMSTTTATTVIIDLIEKVLLDLKNLDDPSLRKLMPELQQVVVLFEKIATTIARLQASSSGAGWIE